MPKGWKNLGVTATKPNSQWAEKPGEPEIGFYAKRSHRIIDTPVCMLQNEVNDRIVKIIRAFLAEYEIPLYDETIHRGLVRHILTRMGRRTGEIMVCLVVNGRKLPHCDVLVERLREIEGMTSIVLNVNTDQTNVILGTEVHVLWGKETIRDYIGDVQFEISPLSFYQVNPLQTQVLYQTALDFAELEGNETVLDLYCGIGTISLFFAQKAKHVFGVEIVPEAIADAKRNATLNSMNNADFAVGAAEDVIPRLYEEKGITADVVVVDPLEKAVTVSCWIPLLPFLQKKWFMYPVILPHWQGIWHISAPKAIPSKRYRWWICSLIRCM